jgi:alkanesulfonate monooxygenase SsuD/methylene tetrahydromethanopterin reductase-like flavin-dependent oxidoreductase (luciferase family)
LAILNLRQGRPDVYPSPEEAAAYPFTPTEAETVRSWTAAHVVGSPSTVKEGLDRLVERTGADELMITTNVHSPAARRHSYSLVAEVMELLAAPVG